MHAGLGQRPLQLVREPAGLAARPAALGIAGVGQHLGEQAEQVAQPGAQRLAGEGQPVGAVVDPQRRRRCAGAPRRARPGTAAGAEHASCAPAGRRWPGRRRGGRRWAPAAGGGPAARSPGVRRPRAARWAAPARRSRAAAACAAWPGRAPRGACARAAGSSRHHPATRSRRARTSGPRAPAAAATCSAVTCSSRSGISWVSSARPRCCSYDAIVEGPAQHVVAGPAGGRSAAGRVTLVSSSSRHAVGGQPVELLVDRVDDPVGRHIAAGGGPRPRRRTGLRTSNASSISPRWQPTSVATRSSCTRRRRSREASPVARAEPSTTYGR